MKKTYLQFPAWGQKNRLPKMNHRFNQSACYLTDGEIAAEKAEMEALKDLPDDTEEIKTVKAIKRIGKQVDSFKTVLGEKADAEQFKTMNETLEALQTDITTMKSEDVTKQIKAINDGNDKIWKQIVEMQEATAKEKEQGGEGNKAGKPLFTTKQVEDFVKATFADGKKTHEYARIEIKAAENFGYPQFFEGGAGTVIDAFTGRFVDPTLYQRRRKKNLILDNFSIGSIAVPKLIYLVKIEDGDDEGSSAGDSGGADWILSSEAKPKRSFRVTTGESEAKKIAIFGTIEDKLLKDVSSLENWVREDFMDEIMEKYNDGLLNNNPSVDPDAPLGMKTNAIQFTATPAFANKYVATESNYIDQVLAALAMMAYNRETAGTAYVSSDVYYAILGLKDTSLRYQNSGLVYTNSLGELFVFGTKLYAADQEDIPSTHLLVTGADLGFKMLNYGPLVFERGLNGEDFRYDRTSYRGYQEVLSYLPTHRENSVMYDTWANITAGIEV